MGVYWQYQSGYLHHGSERNTGKYSWVHQDWEPVVVYASKEFYLEYTSVVYTINKFHQ